MDKKIIIIPTIIIILFLSVTAVLFFSQSFEDKIDNNQNIITDQQNTLSECEKAGGKLLKIKECNGSESDYCILSEKIHCYADLVKGGKCDVEFSEKRYNETGDGMIGRGSGPRVLCDR